LTLRRLSLREKTIASDIAESSVFMRAIGPWDIETFPARPNKGLEFRVNKKFLKCENGGGCFSWITTTSIISLPTWASCSRLLNAVDRASDLALSHFVICRNGRHVLS
jgi:hypothetical protein